MATLVRQAGALCAASGSVMGGDGASHRRRVDGSRATVPLVQLSATASSTSARSASTIARGGGLAVSCPSSSHRNSACAARALQPLLLAHGSSRCPAISRPSSATTVLVTGRTGGKTRILQSLGLAQLMRSPVSSCRPLGRGPLAPGLVVSLIEETKADQAEGRLGTELLRIRQLLSAFRRGAMVISRRALLGNEPLRGEEISSGRADAHAPRAAAFITTHFLTFASRWSVSAPSRICASCR